MPVDIDLAPENPGAGDPAAIFGKHAADLVDIHFFCPFLPAQFVDLDCNGKRLFRDNDCIKIRIEGGAEPVAAGVQYTRVPENRLLSMNASSSAFLVANGRMGWIFRLANASVVSPITTCPPAPAISNDRPSRLCARREGDRMCPRP